jgi:hypothetical protein
MSSVILKGDKKAARRNEAAVLEAGNSAGEGVNRLNFLPAEG